MLSSLPLTAIDILLGVLDGVSGASMRGLVSADITRFRLLDDRWTLVDSACLMSLSLHLTRVDIFFVLLSFSTLLGSATVA